MRSSSCTLRVAKARPLRFSPVSRGVTATTSPSDSLRAHHSFRRSDLSSDVPGAWLSRRERAGSPVFPCTAFSACRPDDAGEADRGRPVPGMSGPFSSPTLIPVRGSLRSTAKSSAFPSDFTALIWVHALPHCGPRICVSARWHLRREASTTALRQIPVAAPLAALVSGCFQGRDFHSLVVHGFTAHYRRRRYPSSTGPSSRVPGGGGRCPER